METHSACPAIDLLERFTTGLSSESEARTLEEHVALCPRCIALLPSLGQGDRLMKALRVQKNKPQPESAVLDQLQKRLLELEPLLTTEVYAKTGSIGVASTPPSGGYEEADEDTNSLLAPPQQPDEIGRLGTYRVLRVLGKGGMGIVFEAEDPRLRRRIALKAMRPALGASSAFRQRFLREAQRLAAVDHDHIVTIHHVGEEGAVLFLEMPLLKGESLEDRLRREGKLPVLEVLRIGRETAQGLTSAHENGVIHRDIKPANLWLEAPSGRVKILDFGLARLAEGDVALTGSCALVGTPSYMAPEQAEGEVDRRADLFSLGCVLYRMATGQLAFPGKTRSAILHAVATLNPPPPRQINPETPERLSRLIEQLLSKDREVRPESAAAVVEALEEMERDKSALKPADTPKSLHQDVDGERLRKECDTSLSTSSTPSSAKAAVSLPQWRRWIWLSAAALLLVGVLAVTGFTLWQGRTATTEIAPVTAKLRVQSLEVKHFVTVNGKRKEQFRLLGDNSFLTHCDDSVEVEARLSRPAYGFMIAFRPDGTEAVCFPEKDDEAPPRTDQLRCPSDSKDFDYGLEEGAGLHAFAVVVSSQRLPSFKEWWSPQGCPWQKSEAPPDVVWRVFDSAKVDGLSADASDGRGLREVQGKASVGQLRDWLRKLPQVESVAVLGFPVLPKD